MYDDIINSLEIHKKEYLEYRGSLFSEDGKLIWAKDDAMAYTEGIDSAIKIIKESK